MNQEKIGKFIYDLRKKYNLTQAELASKLHVTAQAVSKWENGRGVPDIELLKRLSEEFNVSITELIEGEKNTVKRNNYTLLFIPAVVMVLILIVTVLIINNNKSTVESFSFSSLVCNNDSFNIDGVIAYNDTKKSVYISNIGYCDEEDEEPIVTAVECVLYEIVGDEEVELARYGSLDSPSEASYISDYLSEVEFNIDNYSCGCNVTTCNNLSVRIKAIIEEELVVYEIPLSVDSTCSN